MYIIYNPGFSELKFCGGLNRKGADISGSSSDR
jgi:hypothetical protein